jgi:hypothetical protein
LHQHVFDPKSTSPNLTLLKPNNKFDLINLIKKLTLIPTIKLLCRFGISHNAIYSHTRANGHL